MTTEKNPFGLKGIIQSFKETNWKRDLTCTIVISVLLMITLGYFWDYQWFDLLKKGSESLLSIYGGLLGMSIAAYAILIGIPKFSELTRRILVGNRISLYTKVHAQFTMYLLLQIFALSGVFIISMIMGAPASSSTSTNIDSLDQVINALTFFILLFSFLYQMVLIRDSFIIIYNGAILSELQSNK